jgi:hypothetical protein
MTAITLPAAKIHAAARRTILNHERIMGIIAAGPLEAHQADFRGRLHALASAAGMVASDMAISPADFAMIAAHYER